MIKYVQYEAKHRDSVLEFWNRNLEKTFPIYPRLWEQNMRSDFGFMPENSWLVFADGEVVGAVFNKWIDIKIDQSEMSKVGWISSLLVDEEYRGKGLGSELYSRAEKALSGLGVEKISLGAELGHLFPGIPFQSVAAQEFFHKRGYQSTVDVCDLLCTRQGFIRPEHSLTPEVAAQVSISLAKDANDVKDTAIFFQKYFPGRWYYEFCYDRDYGILDGLVILRVQGEVKGFARIYDENSKRIGPGIFWHPLLHKPYGGLGPIGVAKDERGKGLGMELLYRSLEMLWDRGIAEIVIDFTELVDFYGKLGFEPWKWYHRNVKILK